MYFERGKEMEKQGKQKKYVSEGRKEGWPEGMFTHFWKYEIDADESK